jgi:ABC-2 type transport system ATP-binding protein
MSIVIETEKLTKKFGNLTAVNTVSLTVRKGEIYGFLGLNGAGKTTTIRMLLGMIRPSSGESRFFGTPLSSGHPGPWEKIGYLVETPSSYPELTVSENLKAVSRLRDLKGNMAADEIINKLQLGAYADVKARNLSSGNNQRLGLAKALIHKPEILILDEPSNGLDPAGIVEIRELLHDIALNLGVTVFISSHNLSEISRIATRIGIIHHGNLIQEIDAGKLDSVLKKTLLIGTRDGKSASKLISLKGYSWEFSVEGAIRISDPRAVEKPEEINSLLVQAGFPPHLLTLEQEDLETYFLRIIGE